MTQLENMLLNVCTETIESKPMTYSYLWPTENDSLGYMMGIYLSRQVNKNNLKS